MKQEAFINSRERIVSFDSIKQLLCSILALGVFCLVGGRISGKIELCKIVAVITIRIVKRAVPYSKKLWSPENDAAEILQICSCEWNVAG